MLTYVQLTGEIRLIGRLVGVGYSGCGDGKNNPSLQHIHNVGPIPCGVYVIGTPIDTKEHGPFVLPLTPDPRNNMFGRKDFLLHGDSITNPGEASKGCIVANRIIRNTIAESGETLLQVVAEWKSF